MFLMLVILVVSFLLSFFAYYDLEKKIGIKKSIIKIFGFSFIGIILFSILLGLLGLSFGIYSSVSVLSILLIIFFIGYLSYVIYLHLRFIDVNVILYFLFILSLYFLLVLSLYFLTYMYFLFLIIYIMLWIYLGNKMADKFFQDKGNILKGLISIFLTPILYTFFYFRKHLLGAFIFILSILFFNEYLVNHTYYYNMLTNNTNWYIIVFGLIAILIPVIYLFGSLRKTWKGILFSVFLGFAIFSLVIGLNKGGYISWGYLLELLNYIILFSYFGVILVGSLALGNLLLKKISFKENIYNFSIKFGFGFAVLSILLYFIVAFGFINTYISYIIFFGLIYLIYFNLSSLKNISKGLFDDLLEFNQNIDKLGFIKYLLYFVGVIIFFYIFVGFNYTFIAYPTAWDASHAYIYYPKVFIDYNGYPWNTDFRPGYILWSAVLAWIGKLGFWTWFSQDTWMITFNFISGILTLFFGFMLINSIVKIISKKKNVKHYLLVSLGYILILTWLTSGMGGFLMFVDNKTDFAVLMYVILGLFLAIYFLMRMYDFSELEQQKRILNEELSNFKTAKEGNKQLREEIKNIDKDLLNYGNINIFIALSGFFFAIANLVKPTATFDFFEAIIVFSVLNVWVILVVGAIIFVIGILSYLKYRGFDKAIDSKYAMPLIFNGLGISFIGVITALVKNSKKLISLFIFVGAFLGTLIITKGTFGLLQAYHDKNIDTNPKKIVQGIIMGNLFSSKKKNELTGSLYAGLKEPIGSSYNEDNNRYKGYGNHNFGKVWWDFMVPSRFKTTYCISFIGTKCGKFDDKIYEKLLNNYTFDILKNKDILSFNKMLENTIKHYGIRKLALQFHINLSGMKQNMIDILKPKIAKALENQISNDIKKLIKNKEFDINKYPGIVKNKRNEDILKYLKNNNIIYTTVNIPYDYLIPFNVSFNRSLQNSSSYYTDIGIVWLLLAIIVIIAFIYSIVLFFISFRSKNLESKKYALFLLAFSGATLVGWGIWYFVAAGIVWYNIGGIIWLIITSLIFVSKLKDKGFLIYVLFIVSISSIFLNLFRIASQGGSGVYMWYKSSLGQKEVYYKTTNGFDSKKSNVLPYKKEHLVNMQFPQYKKAIKGFNDRHKGNKGIIGGTYMKYFVRNQDKIIDDQFLMYLWKLGSDDNIEKFYKRLKDQNITDIVLDPNIASVILGKGNIELWYRYFGEVDKNGTFVTKGVLPKMVDLAQKGNLEYVYTNNLAIKYSLIYKDEELSEILGIQDLKTVRKIRYELIALRFLQRNIGFEYPDLATKMQNEGLQAYQKILFYRIKQAIIGYVEAIVQDIEDINAFDINGKIEKKVINNLDSAVVGEKWNFDKKATLGFNELPDKAKELILITRNYILSIKNNHSVMKKILHDMMSQGLQSRAQIFYIKIK